VASLDRRSGFVQMTNGESGGEWLLKLITGDVMERFL
jgi:hypothetical protein